MKKIYFIFFLSLGFNLNLLGQEFVLDNTKLFGPANFSDYKSLKPEYTTHYTNLRKNAYNLKSNGKAVKNNRKYDRIDFTIDGKALYAKDVKYKSDGGQDCFPNCKMYYASNNQLYYDYNPENKLIAENPIYHENGKLWNVLLTDEEDPEVQHFVVWDNTGNVVFDKAYLPGMKIRQSIQHPKYGYGYFEFVPAKKPSFYPSHTYFNFPTDRQELMDWRNENKALYYGYTHLGSFINNMWGYTITGFMLPTNFKLGNGSVVFLEDKVSNKNYWAVILDQEIKFKLEAKAEEKPNIIQLMQQTDIEMYKDHLAKMVSKNIQTINGYGINLIPQDNKEPGDGIFMEVGQFKNGKLHGVGYRTKMVFGNITKGGLTTIDASYGLFENGQPVNVKHIKAFNEKPVKNFWDPVPIEGFTHVGDKSKDLFFNSSDVNLNDLKKYDEIYIEKIHRVAKIKSINPTGQTITVFSDNPEIDVKLDKSIGNIFVKATYLGDRYGSCPKTIRVPVYAEKYESYFVPAEYKSNSYVVKGVYYDKHVTNSTYKPAEVASKKVRYIEKYVDQVCSRCNGTGHVAQGMENKILWRNIKFKDATASANSKSSTPNATTTANANFACLTGDCNETYSSGNGDEGYYRGFFKNHHLNGYGYHKAKNNDYYYGDFENGLYSGFGMYTWKQTGEYYIGQFKNGKKNGYGYIKKGGDVLKAGFFIDDILMTDMITENYRNKQMIAQCVGNCSDGFGYYKYSDGSSYIGFFKDRKPNHVGSYNFRDGTAYIGEWEKGVRKGMGFETYGNGSSYSGEFINNSRNGLGVLTDKSEKIISNGYWTQGKFIGTKPNKETEAKFIPVNISNKNLSLEAKTFFEAYNNNPKNVGQYVTDVGKALSDQNYKGEALYPKFFEVLKEIYEVDKYAAFKMLMVVDKKTLEQVLKMMPADMRTYMREQAKLTQQK